MIDPTIKARIEPAVDSVEGSDVIYAVMCEACGEHLGMLANVHNEGRIVRAC